MCHLPLVGVEVSHRRSFPHLAIMSPADTIRRGQDVVDDLRSDLADGAEPYLPGGADTTMLAAWDALLAERERDKEHIARLTEALEQLTEIATNEIVGYRSCSVCVVTAPIYAPLVAGHEEDCPLHAVEVARAVLADEEEGNG